MGNHLDAEFLNGGHSVLLQPVSTRSWWIDDFGGWHECVNAANDSADNDPFDALPLRRVAFHQLGMVWIQESLSRTLIAWDLTRADMNSLQSALRYLTTRAPIKPVRLKFHHGGWCREDHADAHSALKRIMVLRAVRDEQSLARLYMQPHDISLIRDAAPLLRRSLDSWSYSRRGLEDSTSRSLSRQLDFMQVYSLNPENGDVIFDHVGRRTMIANLLGEDWRRRSRGMIAGEAHADKEFEDAVCVPYWRVLTDGQPYYDHVRALVNLRGNDSAWISYQRLILPLHEPGQELKLAVIVQPAQRISIPFMETTGMETTGMETAGLTG